MWELDHKESWVLKNWCFWTVVLEKTLESPLDSKEIQPVNPKGNQTLIFIGRTDAKAKAPILWPPDVKNWLIGKDPDAGKDWRQEEKGTTEDKTVGWHYQLNGHEFEQAPGVGDRQGSLVCCSPWGHKELDMTEQLNWTELYLLSAMAHTLWSVFLSEQIHFLPITLSLIEFFLWWDIKNLNFIIVGSGWVRVPATWIQVPIWRRRFHYCHSVFEWFCHINC